jgi:hypothetical protein
MGEKVKPVPVATTQEEKIQPTPDFDDMFSSPPSQSQDHHPDPFLDLMWK